MLSPRPRQLRASPLAHLAGLWCGGENERRDGLGTAKAQTNKRRADMLLTWYMVIGVGVISSSRNLSAQVGTSLAVSLGRHASNQRE